MKATEVMLNDLVMCNNKVCKVCSIEGVMVLVSFKDGEKLTIEDNIEPIPITPEILEKNGFTNEGYFAKLAVEEYVVICGCSNVAVLQNDKMKMDIPIKYVHEFQRALKCCGLYELANSFII